MNTTAVMNNTRHLNNVKRSLIHWNFAGQETNNNNIINSNNSIITVGTKPDQPEQETLLRKAGTQLGRVLEGGTDVVVAPAKWLVHMQENWLSYLICGTILLVCLLLIYCYVRRKLSSNTTFSTADKNISKTALMEAMKLAALRHSLPDI